jgi:hypothetical protein
MRESKVEAYFVQGCKERGWETIKIMMASRRGVFDRAVFMPGEVVWVELKAEDGVLSNHQEKFQHMCATYDVRCSVLYGTEEVDAWFSLYDSTNKTRRASFRVARAR